MRSSVKFLLPLLLLVACNNTPKDDGSSPPSPFTTPKSWEANPKGGYKVNMLTGLPVEPLTTKDGKPIITGIPIPAIGKRINPDSIAQPKSEKPTFIKSATEQIENSYPVPENLEQIPLDETKLIKYNATNSPQGYVLKNPLGNSIPSCKPIVAKGKIAKGISPKITPMLPLSLNSDVLSDVQYLGVDQGLQSQFINSIFQDKSGYIWMGVLNNGVSRYDGRSLVTYREFNGIIGKNVNAIMQDKKGQLWFGTDKGVSKFDGKTFLNFTTAEGLVYDVIDKIMEDKSGNIWFATNYGVSRFEPSKEDSSAGTFINYTTNEGLSNNLVNALIQDKSGNLWFSTFGGGVNKFDGKSFTHYTKKEGLVNDTVRSIMQSKAGEIWIGTKRGASKFDGKTFTNFPTELFSSNPIPINSISSIVEDKSGKIWFGTRPGEVSIYDGKRFVYISESEGLSYNAVTNITFIDDKSGSMWIGTNGGGINRVPINSFLRYTKNRGLADNFTWSALQDPKGNLWFGSNRGINRYDGKIFTYFLNPSLNYSSYRDKSDHLWFGSSEGVIKYDGTSLLRFTTAQGLVNNNVWSIFEDRRGDKWFGTGRGLTRYHPNADGKSGSFFHYTETEGYVPTTTNAIIEDKSGNLWFRHNLGITKYIPSADGQSGSFIHFTAAEGLGDLGNTNTILEDKNGDIWFTSQNGNGLIKYQPSKKGHSGIFTQFTTDQGLASNSVLSVFEDKQGILWIGTNGGLSKYDGKAFQNFTKTDGLSSNQLRQTAEDQSGNLWIATLGGGVNKLEKDLYKLSQKPLIVGLRQLYINETVPDFRNPADSTAQNIKFDGVQAFENYPINPRIPFGQNHLSFQYVAIDLATTNKIKYSYRLLGLEQKWSIPLTRTTADYRNLPDGKFIFQVRAVGESGEWSKSFDYVFTILPPWYKAWWAYTLYALLFLVALRAFSFWRERRLRQEKVLLQEKVEERTVELKKKSDELEHSLEDLKSTQSQLIQSEKMASLGELTAGIAHEIQNPLNFVNNFSEVSSELIFEIKEERAKNQEARDETLITEILGDIEQNLEKINHHGKRAADIVKGMLQHSRTSSGVKEPTDINALADEYLRLAYHGLRAKDKSFNATMKTDFDESIGNVNIIPQDIGRVILNLITNAFYACTERKRSALNEEMLRDAQHDNQGYEPTVWVSTKKEGNKVFVSVKDNGNGIPQKILDKIFQPFFTTKPTGQGTGLGLSLSYDIVKAHGGELKVETKEGEGSEFIISIPVV
ncbi:MAG: hypothetical protein EAZ13_06670 [Sphingobacteriia bacterium]|nr:MAG: hypothetical protein EAZ13_06670 [Sphingobacteriia bacterium]